MTATGFDWAAVVVPSELPDVTDDPISYERVIMNPGSTWDYFPGHYDPEYARAIGQSTIFVNTMHVAGFIDRVATDWAGSYSRVVRRKVSLAGSIYAGDTITGRRRITGKRQHGDRWLIDMHVDVVNQRGELCCPADVTLDVSKAVERRVP
ncbi:MULTISPECIES: MaoC/PaaZ C-terminal domain-containing protein [unclassified Mycobacterium]|uniref:MaoC/PaaZ C-terminal domain-containing protein n=1 Tax=unclassified Mycobacterium TaxID=2642494 RepID=UPI0029C6E1EB|nr:MULTISPECIES: MaoC/PaaZ C-terminal domain-containing protein [unclassified Mycobacterium]